MHVVPLPAHRRRAAGPVGLLTITTPLRASTFGILQPGYRTPVQSWPTMVHPIINCTPYHVIVAGNHRFAIEHAAVE